MRYCVASLALLLLCTGCLPKKTPEGKWETTLWSIPLKIDFKDGQMTGKGKYKDADVSISGTYSYSEKDGGSAFQMNVTDVQIKHGNPFTQEMLTNEIQSVVAPRSYGGYVKFEKPLEMDFVVESAGSASDSHIIFVLAKP